MSVYGGVYVFPNQKWLVKKFGEWVDPATLFIKFRWFSLVNNGQIAKFAKLSTASY